MGPLGSRKEGCIWGLDMEEAERRCIYYFSSRSKEPGKAVLGSFGRCR